MRRSVRPHNFESPAGPKRLSVDPRSGNLGFPPCIGTVIMAKRLLDTFRRPSFCVRPADCFSVVRVLNLLEGVYCFG